MRPLVLILILALLQVSPLLARCADAEPGPWSLVLYGGRNTDDSFGNVARGRAQYYNDYLLAVSANRRIGSFERLLRFEVEGQVVKHLELESHWEFNAVFVIRWLPFFWDDLVDTSFAVGEGLSVASEVSELEGSLEEDSHEALNFVFVELDFFLPDRPRWGLVTRLQHRSGVFGLYYGEHDAANSVGLGVKVRF